ncbi:MAG: PEP-CTERM sorting domain-containing protein [Anaerolineae bacterium]|nr:PEP-CTERM sorting domain-containing protein [Anaerolineae bacterium]
MALGQGLTVSVDQTCFECYSDPSGPDEQHIVRLEIEGIDEGLCLCYSLDRPTEPVPANCWPPITPQEEWMQFIGCVQQETGDATIQRWIPPEQLYGEWAYRFWQQPGQCVPYPGYDPTVGPITRTIVLAEDCSALEFVPEPGTSALLGSGLAGLAGYATLRWRGRS